MGHRDQVVDGTSPRVTQLITHHVPCVILVHLSMSANIFYKVDKIMSNGIKFESSGLQVCPLTQLYYVDFSISRMGVNMGVFIQSRFV